MKYEDEQIRQQTDKVIDKTVSVIRYILKMLWTIVVTVTTRLYGWLKASPVVRWIIRAIFAIILLILFIVLGQLAASFGRDFINTRSTAASHTTYSECLNDNTRTKHPRPSDYAKSIDYCKKQYNITY